MSNAGQALSAVAGAVIGFFVGGPTGAYYGFQVGYLAGTALFPTQLPHLQGPRLGEGQQTVSTVGQPIPWIFGTQVVGGNIIWASPIREVATTEDVGGKGGPEQSQTTYTYYRSFAILLCEGPIGGVRRVWANGKILYDARPQLDGESAEEFAARQAINQDFLSKVTIYLGTEDQMPDPTIESFKGAGNVPAYRGYAYAVFNDVELKAEDGNRMPAGWKWEVYEEGTDTPEELTFYSNEVMYPWSYADPHNPMNPLNKHEVIAEDTSGGPFPTLSAAVQAASWRTDQRMGWATHPNGQGGPLMPWKPLPNPLTDQYQIYFSYAQEDYDYVITEVIDDYTGFMCVAVGANNERIWWTGERPPGSSPAAQPRAVWRQTAHSAGTFNCDNDPNSPAPLRVEDKYVIVRRIPQPPPKPSEAGIPSGIPGWYIYDGRLTPDGEWQFISSGTYRVLQEHWDGGAAPSSRVKLPLNPCRPTGHPEYDDQAFWEAAHEQAVAAGLMEPGTYGVDYPDTQVGAYRLNVEYSSTVVQPVSLASIVSRICDRVGLPYYNVDDLEDQYIIGYQVSRPMAARAAIEPLRSVGFFDVVENGVALKFTKRGKAPVATLTHDDLGAHFATEERPSAITTTKALELELPRQFRVHYQNPDLDFDPGEELSPARFDTAAETVTDIDLAVAITPDKAAQIAEVMLREAWASRWVCLTTVDVSQSKLQPADCVLVPVDGSLDRMRIVNVTERLPNIRQLELVRDDDGAYVSTAEGSSTQRPPTRLEFYGPVESVFMDLPPLTTSHNDAGFYAAARPLISGGAFRGASVSRSYDGGGTYSAVASVTGLAAMGTIVMAVPEGPTTIFDYANEIRVKLSSGAVESLDEESILQGLNAAAIGAHGRWEIVQFVNATHVAGDVYSLTTLLRGRRGTEHNVGTAVPGDMFVLLADVGRVPLAIEDVDAALQYRVSPIGGRQSTDVKTFTGTGEALRPFAPVHVEGSRDSSGHWSISWIRRDRLATDLDEAMSEAVEDYEVDILDSFGEVRRTISTSVNSITYTSAQQVADFGAAQTSITIRVYQISEDVGRGYPAEATL